MEVTTFINNNSNSSNIMTWKWTGDLVYSNKWAPAASIKFTQVPILPAPAVIIVSHIPRSLQPLLRPHRLHHQLHQHLQRPRPYHQLNSGGSTTSSAGSSGYGSIGKGKEERPPMASMMDEMQKTLARRRAKVEKGDDDGTKP